MTPQNKLTKETDMTTKNKLMIIQAPCTFLSYENLGTYIKDTLDKLGTLQIGMEFILLIKDRKSANPYEWEWTIISND